MGMKISVLYLGHMEFPKFRLVQTPDEQEMVKSPAVAILIRHPTLGNLLYDTGNSPEHLTAYTKEMLHDYPVVDCVSIRDALAEKGLTPNDIDRIILSHLHFDHAGGLKVDFRHADTPTKLNFGSHIALSGSAAEGLETFVFMEIAGNPNADLSKTGEDLFGYANNAAMRACIRGLDSRASGTLISLPTKVRHTLYAAFDALITSARAEQLKASIDDAAQ